MHYNRSVDFGILGRIHSRSVQFSPLIHVVAVLFGVRDRFCADVIEQEKAAVNQPNVFNYSI